MHLLGKKQTIIAKHRILRLSHIPHVSIASYWANLTLRSGSFIHNLFLYPWPLLNVNVSVFRSFLGEVNSFHKNFPLLECALLKCRKNVKSKSVIFMDNK